MDLFNNAAGRDLYSLNRNLSEDAFGDLLQRLSFRSIACTVRGRPASLCRVTVPVVTPCYTTRGSSCYGFLVYLQ